MGHSEVFPLRDAAAANRDAANSGAAVRVWGDMNHPADFEAHDDGAGAAPAQHAPDPAQAGSADAGGAADGEHIYHRIGHLTRTLHEALRELGYHESLADAHSNLPDARDRLAYIARLTGDAAEKVLNSVDRARGIQEQMSENALDLRRRWSAVGAYTAKGGRATPAGAQLVEETCAFLESLGSRAGSTNAILTEIMMAQDFHDLTGQVIRKVVTLAQTLEEQLLRLLLESQPGEHQKRAAPEALEGPVVNAENRDDVVTDQAGVDDLLASLGF